MKKKYVLSREKKDLKNKKARERRKNDPEHLKKMKERSKVSWRKTTEASKQRRREYYHKNKEKIVAWKKDFYKKTKEKYRLRKIEKVFGITVDQYKTMFNRQSGVCAICKKQEPCIDSRSNIRRNLSVDHDHITGEVRGLLCSNCNMGIGKFKDNVLYLHQTMVYLMWNTFEKLAADIDRISEHIESNPIEETALAELRGIADRLREIAAITPDGEPTPEPPEE